MTAYTSLTDHLLIAMPCLKDPNFENAVVYICEHDESGAMGLIINQPLDAYVDDIYQQLNLECPIELATQPVLFGGPVETNQIFVLHERYLDWNATLPVNEHRAITTSKDILASFNLGLGPTNKLFCLGYAGWGPGQLEQEIQQNAWLHSPRTTNQILFDCPSDKKLDAAVRTVGIRMEQLSDLVGHA